MNKNIAKFDEVRTSGRKPFIDLCFKEFLAPILIENDNYNKIQVIFHPDKKKEVLFNEETHKIYAYVKPRKGIKKKLNDPIFSNELERGKGNILIFDSYIKSKENCFFISAKKNNKGIWKIFTNFMFNKEIAKKYIENSQQFLSVAEISREKYNKAPFAVNIYKAIELALMAFIITTPFINTSKGICRPFYPDSPQNTWRKKTFKKFRQFIKLGFLGEEYFSIINELYHLRDNLGYIKKDQELTREMMDNFIRKTKKVTIQLRKTVFERERYSTTIKEEHDNI